MSIRLPNGSRIYPKTIEGFEAIEKCLREKTPIVVTPVDVSPKRLPQLPGRTSSCS